MQNLLKNVFLGFQKSFENLNIFGNNIVGNEYNSIFKIDDIDFFNFIFEKEKSIVNSRKYIFYKDVYIFVNRLKKIVIIKNNNKIREILSIYLCDEIFIWYFTKFTNLEKTLLKITFLKIWFEFLTKRFKKRIIVIIQYF